MFQESSHQCLLGGDWMNNPVVDATEGSAKHLCPWGAQSEIEMQHVLMPHNILRRCRSVLDWGWGAVPKGVQCPSLSKEMGKCHCTFNSRTCEYNNVSVDVFQVCTDVGTPESCTDACLSQQQDSKQKEYSLQSKCLQLRYWYFFYCEVALRRAIYSRRHKQVYFLCVYNKFNPHLSISSKQAASQLLPSAPPRTAFGSAMLAWSLIPTKDGVLS